MMIQVREYTTVDEMLNNYERIHRKFMTPMEEPVLESEEPVAILDPTEDEMITALGLKERIAKKKDRRLKALAHAKSRCSHRVGTVARSLAAHYYGSPPKRIQRLVADRYGVPAHTTKQTKELSAVRHLSYAVVHLAHPQLSLMDLGRMFNKDHSTIVNGLERIGIR